MAIEREVFGSYVEEIDVSVEVEYRGVRLCCGRKYMSFVKTYCFCSKNDSRLGAGVGNGARYL